MRTRDNFYDTCSRFLDKRCRNCGGHNVEMWNENERFQAVCPDCKAATALRNKRSDTWHDFAEGKITVPHIEEPVVEEVKEEPIIEAPVFIKSKKNKFVEE